MRTGSKTIEIGLEGGSQRGPYFYGRFVEKGTKKMRAKPFLAPAARDCEMEVQQTMAEAIRRKLGI